MLFQKFIALWCAVLFVQTTTAAPTVACAEPDVHTYKTVGDRNLKIIVTEPQGWSADESRPCVMFFHGGGWTGGQPGQFDRHCQRLASLGLVCAQVEYRLLTNKPNQDADATPTVCIQDAKSAIRWVRSHANQLGIDTDRIASAGGSAGGHLAAFLGTTDGVDDPQDDQTVSARSNAMLLFNPVYNNGPGNWGAARVGSHFQKFSPAHNVSADDVPSIVFLGTKTNWSPLQQPSSFKTR